MSLMSLRSLFYRQRYAYGLALLFVLFSLLLAGCGQGMSQSPVPAAEATAQSYAERIINETPQSPLIGLGDITRNPERYLGQRVTVRGEVDDIIYAGGFFMGEGLPIGRGQLVVLYTDNTNGIILNHAKPVQVTGTVQRFDRVYLERNPELDLEDDFYRDLENRIVILADAVREPL